MTNRAFRLVIWLAVSTLAAIYAWHGRNDMNPDGISYLDTADAYSRGDFARGIQSFWSPLYPWIIATIFKIARPSPEWEFAAVHLINLAIFMFTLCTFHFFWRSSVGYSDRAWTVFGYSLFTWSILDLVTLSVVTPDLLVVMFVLIAAALLNNTVHAQRTFSGALLGCVLACGYFAKAAMLPLGLAFLLLSFWATRSLRFFSAAAAAFVFTCAPWVFALSTARHYFTFGDVGPINYAWFVDDASLNPNWYLHPEPGGGPVTKARRAYQHPAVFEFHGPPAITYPIWYDVQDWYRTAPHFSVRGHIRAFGRAAWFFWKLFTGRDPDYPIADERGWSAVLLAAVIPLLPAWRRVLSATRRHEWVLVWWSLCALGLYAAVHIESRYVAGFLVLLWLILLSGYRTLDSTLRASVLAVVSCALVLPLITPIPKIAGEVIADVRAQRVAADDYAATRELQRLGVAPGDGIAWLGYSFDSYLARLGRFHIVAEVPNEEVEAFWRADRGSRAGVFAAMSHAGARAIVTRDVPLDAADDWHKLGCTRIYARALGVGTAELER